LFDINYDLNITHTRLLYRLSTKFKIREWSTWGIQDWSWTHGWQYHS